MSTRKPRTEEQKRKDALAARERRARKKVEGTMKGIRSFARKQVRAMEKKLRVAPTQRKGRVKKRHDGAQVCISMAPWLYDPVERFRKREGFSRSKLIEAALEAYCGKRGVKFAKAS